MAQLINIDFVRSQFPALASRGKGLAPVFLDNPGGTQVPQRVPDAVSNYLLNTNANYGGAFRTSMDSDAMQAQARAAMADLLNVPEGDHIVFGANMTSITFNMSRAIGLTLKPGDEVVLTKLDHDGNISPWVLMARDVGAEIKWVDFDPADTTLSIESFQKVITDKTKLVAFCLASNATGTISDAASICRLARKAGALSYIDAVAYTPHAPIDVQAYGCDFLVCSAYKFFGPHIGVLYGRADVLDELKPYKLRPAQNVSPHKFETGTQNFECWAGTMAAVDYLAELGRDYCEVVQGNYSGLTGRRLDIRRAMMAIKEYEQTLSASILDTLESLDGITIYGITDRESLNYRVPIMSFTLEGKNSRQIAEDLGRRDIYVWNGNYYALVLAETLGVLENGGMVRVGAVHYNNASDMDRFANAMKELAG